MKQSELTSEVVVDPLDGFAHELQQLREAQDVSYADLAHHVSALRVSRGLHEAAARTPRSTVYNCFRTGRARIDIGLLRDIVLVLTGDEAEAERWVDRYLEVRKRSGALRRQAAPPPALTPTRPQFPTVSLNTLLPAKPAWGTVILVILAAVLMNRLGMALNSHFGFGLFLDMIGTCVAAIMLGPWYGVAVAVLYQGIALFTYFDLGVLFGLVNITGALVWGYGVRRFRMGHDLSRFTLLSIATAIACSAVGIPINMFLFSVHAATGMDAPTQALESMGFPFAFALFSANLTTSVIDKLLTGFVGLVVFVAAHQRFSFQAAHMPLVEHLGLLKLRAGVGLDPAFSTTRF